MRKFNNKKEVVKMSQTNTKELRVKKTTTKTKKDVVKKPQTNTKELRVKKTTTKTKKENKHVIKSAKSKYVLRLKKVTKSFGSFQALKNITFDIKKGERIGIIGGNGAGKTTVTEIIAGINKPSSGEIRYGFDFNDSPKEGIGMQFQQSSYPSGLTVKDIINFAFKLRNIKMSKTELKEILETFQMNAFYTRKVRSLSGGQRQKINILLSILHNPSLVILDELSTGLDISARQEIIKFTNAFLDSRDMSLILISHHMAEIRAMCSKVIVLDNGEVVGIKTIKEIEDEYGSLEKYSIKLIEISNQRTINLASGKTLDGKPINNHDNSSREAKKKTKILIKDSRIEKKLIQSDKKKREKQNIKAKKKYGDIDLTKLDKDSGSKNKTIEKLKKEKQKVIRENKQTKKAKQKRNKKKKGGK